MSKNTHTFIRITGLVLLLFFASFSFGGFAVMTHDGGCAFSIGEAPCQIGLAAAALHISSYQSFLSGLPMIFALLLLFIAAAAAAFLRAFRGPSFAPLRVARLRRRTSRADEKLARYFARFVRSPSL